MSFTRGRAAALFIMYLDPGTIATCMIVDVTKSLLYGQDRTGPKRTEINQSGTKAIVGRGVVFLFLVLRSIQ